MLDLNGNLEWAEKAVRYTRERMSYGWLGNKVCTSVSRWFGRQSGERNMCDFIRSWASRALRAGCGNCAEQAAIAFMYLVRSGIVPVDYMGFVQQVDHAFVVIGRAHNSSIGNVSTWGQCAVICDPYENLYYRVLPANQNRPFHRYLKQEGPTCICSRRDNTSPLEPC